MNKKTIILLILITAVLTFLIYFKLTKFKRFYYLKTTDFSAGTGAVSSSPIPELILEGQIISNLQKQLPYTRDSFTITKFDYKTARFVVEFKEKTETSEQEFFDWLSGSEFSPIPQKRFEVK